MQPNPFPASATRWISRTAAVNGLLVAGENPGYDMSASLNSFYADRSSSGMMATRSSKRGFQVWRGRENHSKAAWPALR
jgi:hypothetical protein